MKYNLLLCLATLVIIFQSCKDDEEMIDPCLTAVETTADFDFMYRFSGKDSVYWLPALDTFYSSASGSRLYFKAKSSKMATYEWTIGNDPRVFTDSIVFLDFYALTGPITATLIVTNQNVVEGCFSSDASRDTITKTISARDFDWSQEDLPITGIYEGYDEDNPNETYTI